MSSVPRPRPSQGKMPGRLPNDSGVLVRCSKQAFVIPGIPGVIGKFGNLTVVMPLCNELRFNTPSG